MAQVVMVVHETNGVFGASFPDFPGCTTVADDVDVLMAQAPAVLAFHIKGMAEDHLPIPHSRSLGALWGDPLFQYDRSDAVLVTTIDCEALALPVEA